MDLLDVQVVLPVFHHEAHAVRAPDSTVLIYMIKYDGGELPGLLSEECLQPACHGYNISHQVTAMAWSSSVYGPWSEKILFNPWPGPDNRESWLCQTNCPSVTFTPSGEVRNNGISWSSMSKAYTTFKRNEREDCHCYSPSLVWALHHHFQRACVWMDGSR